MMKRDRSDITAFDIINKIREKNNKPVKQKPGRIKDLFKSIKIAKQSRKSRPSAKLKGGQSGGKRKKKYKTKKRRRLNRTKRTLHK